MMIKKATFSMFSDPQRGTKGDLSVNPSVWVVNEQSILFFSLGFWMLIGVGWLTGAGRVSQQDFKQSTAIVIQKAFKKAKVCTATNRDLCTLYVPVYVKKKTLLHFPLKHILATIFTMMQKTYFFVDVIKSFQYLHCKPTPSCEP